MKVRYIRMFLLIALVMTISIDARPMEKMDLINNAKKVTGEMTPEKLQHLLLEGEDVIVLDVREQEQRAEGSIPYGEFNQENFYAITRGNLEWEIDTKIKDKDALIVTYCRKGGRGALAAEVLRKMGYKNATVLKGGLTGWAKVGYPVRTGLGTVVLEKNKVK